MLNCYFTMRLNQTYFYFYFIYMKDILLPKSSILNYVPYISKNYNGICNFFIAADTLSSTICKRIFAVASLRSSQKHTEVLGKFFSGLYVVFTPIKLQLLFMVFCDTHINNHEWLSRI